ncbi:MAG: SufE family protein [Bacteroidetes bacterium]|nr:SufE family protein [Bacteroidota bacterium]
MSIAAKEAEIIDEFSMFGDWTEKYEYLIDLGRSLPLIDESLKTDDNLIKGCQSRVWMDASIENGKVHYRADSDAQIPKGIVSLLVRVLSDESPEEIVESPLSFIDKIGLQEHLSPTRANGLVSMVKQMKMYALAFQHK